MLVEVLERKDHLAWKASRENGTPFEVEKVPPSLLCTARALVKFLDEQGGDFVTKVAASLKEQRKERAKVVEARAADTNRRVSAGGHKARGGAPVDLTTEGDSDNNGVWR